MSRRRWTILVVPHGVDPSRAFEVTERGIRRVAWGAAGGAVAVLGSFALVLRLTGAMVPADHETGRLVAQVTGLRDTIAVIAVRDAQIRLLAGLPTPVTASAGPLPAGVGIDVDGLISQANTLSASFAEVSSTLERNNDRMASTPSIMPTAGWLSSEFSKARFHPILHVERPHEGIDLAAPYGAPVVAPAAGTIILITRQTGYGLVLEIDHGNGIVTKYAHLSSVAVRAGQRVTRGDLIAAVGNSGLSTGPHLHYEIHVNGQVVDPLTYVLPGAIPD
jgi:murein DD-endopeptidase MepM/ murein hydrolase activator NlpD